MRHLWFWSFWHWSTESYRGGALLRGPVLGVGGHWDEWYRHEATAAERAEIAADGRDAAAQRRFAWWLARRWAREATWDGARPPARFVLGQLAAFPPFDRWEALACWRAGYGAPGLPAIVLAEGSAGEADDVRAVDAVAVPAEAASDAPALVPEGFRADAAELETVRRAARSALGGRGLATLLALWLAAGRRPAPRALGAALAAGWAVVAAIVVRLRVGADPGDALAAWCAALVALWAALTLVALGVAAATGAALWHGGRRLAARLDRSEVRLRLRGGMTVRGASAGLPLALDTVLALAHAERAGERSWLWRRVAGGLRARAATWAATGVVTADGRVRPVVLEPKLRACVRSGRVTHVLTPRQRGVRLDAETRRLRRVPCRHVAQALLAAGGLTSRAQLGTTLLALAASVAVVAAAPDLRRALLPAPAPLVVGPGAPSPYALWVTLDTPRPADFVVELESGFWANRRALAAATGRAELRLRRLARQTAAEVDDGTVWVARRRRFLGRELAPGERVGRFTFSYVAGRE